jgi:hypothetical protein
MKNNWIAKIMISGAFLAAPLFSAMPLRNGDGSMGGVWYDFGLRGEFITDARVASELWSHQVKFGYAPWEYAELDLGIGGASFEIPRYDAGQFDGDIQLTTSAALMVQSPALFKQRLRVRGNIGYQYWRSEGKNITYEAHAIDPSASLAIQWPRIEVEGGLLAHWTKGKSSGTNFSNNYLGRGFFALVVHNKQGYFIKTYGDFSPNIEGWDHGPRETSLGLQVGWRMCASRSSQPGELDRYFPAVPKMRKQQDEMKKEMDR